MATGQLSHSEVKSIEDMLEVSPSQHDSSGSYGGAPSTKVGGQSAAGNHKLATPESEFKMTDRGRPIPQFQKQFAHNAQNDKA